MADTFKENLEKFLLYFIEKIGDQVDIETIQTQYNSLIDEFLNYEFIPKGEIDNILESELGKTEQELTVLKEKNNELLKQIENLNTQIKIHIQQKEGLNQKIDILQTAVDEVSTLKSEKEKILIDLTNLKADNDRLQFKLNESKDEMEIYKKNLKRNFIMEKQIKALTEENEKLSFKNRNLNNMNASQELCAKYEKEIQNLKETLGNIHQQINNITNENQDFKNQSDVLNERVLNLEKENKLIYFKLEETVKQRDMLVNTNNELNNKIKEIEFSNKSNILVLGKQNKELKKEIQTLKQIHM